MNVAAKAESVCFSTKGQVVIPRRLRKEFEIEEGTRAYVESTPEGILIRPVTAKFIRGLRGSLKGKGVMKAMMDDRRAERELGYGNQGSG
jgi:AbrB family looped-hinge helix DNA binding protein